MLKCAPSKVDTNIELFCLKPKQNNGYYRVNAISVLNGRQLLCFHVVIGERGQNIF